MTVHLFAGASGFSYKPWKGPFYPVDLPDAGMLGYYAARLPTVEINNTFYRMPKAKVLEDSAGVFQEKVFDNFRNVNDSLEKSLKGIRSFASTAEELAQGQSVLLRQLQDVIASVKPKSRWDWLKQDFDENKKALDPLPDDHHLLSDLQSARYPETTSWLLKSDRFTN